VYVNVLYFKPQKDDAADAEAISATARAARRVRQTLGMGPPVIKGDPRLCRGGSKSLTVPTITPTLH
jgi:hypothetical protein